MGVGDGDDVPWPPGWPAHDTAATNTTANHDARIVTRRSSRLKPVAEWLIGFVNQPAAPRNSQLNRQ
jgi:hypothetical protein